LSQRCCRISGTTRRAPGKSQRARP
jgi:hypothetical protein